MIDLKSPDEIEIMYTNGQLLSEIAQEIKDFIAPDMPTLDLDMKAKELFKKKGLEPAFLNYGDPPFPASICTSINQEVVHGIPSKKRIIKEGDLISIDLGGLRQGFFVDMAFTIGLGDINIEKRKLINTCRRALETGISNMYTNKKLYDISWAIQDIAEKQRYSVVRDLVGHGIGRKLHESPQVPNYGNRNTGMKLEPGLVLALEPMLNIGTHEIKVKADRWTVETADGSLSCHFENTAAVTDKGPRILTGIQV